ncbi:diheme cytochrome c [Sulfuriflexus mobilis]|uniref:diheme cytochrome c n=1 Tax=Sulfuriflexus mobilis TaxID=1811807 RepID=UPI0015598BA7|nr:diheme cytochrome c [Sulfuriflexus mobilis]
MMNIYRKLLALAVVTAGTGLLLSVTVYGDNDREEKDTWLSQSRLDVASVKNSAYQAECGSCHFAYQPGWLPERSWRKLMGGLENHFGDNAELTAEDQGKILDFLVSNAADKSDFKRSKRISGSLKQEDVPLRITDTVYFKRKHHEIPAGYIQGNKMVGSLSNCAACHTRAESGSFNEHEVKIPGVGRWDD